MTNQRPRFQQPWALALAGLASLLGAFAAWRILGSQQKLEVAIYSWPGYEYLYLA